jgi:hypothetical protein
MTTVSASSPYPFDLSDLLPRAHALAESLGDIPSRNRLMKELKIGAPKATALREALAEDGTDDNGTDAVPAPVKPMLTLVPDPAPVPDSIETSAEAVSGQAVVAPAALPLATGDGHPDTNITTTDPGPAAATTPARKPVAWPVLLLALPAFVAIWSGWVGLGELTGFGVMHPLPGIWDAARLNTAITLPIGVETYAAFALWVWLSGRAPVQARRFARWSAIGSLIFGAAGQVAYHLMSAAHMVHAPWLITAAVACLPVAVLGMGAALAHLMHANPADA